MQAQGREQIDAAARQALPTGEGTEILPLVLKDLQDRATAGKLKYGTTLKTGNGRDVLLDIYQELLDAAMYIRQQMAERDEYELYLYAEDVKP